MKMKFYFGKKYLTRNIFIDHIFRYKMRKEHDKEVLISFLCKQKLNGQQNYFYWICNTTWYMEISIICESIL